MVSVERSVDKDAGDGCCVDRNENGEDNRVFDEKLSTQPAVVDVDQQLILQQVVDFVHFLVNHHLLLAREKRLEKVDELR